MNMNNTDNMNHSLPLAIANELNRMEANLTHMPNDVRGYKQLCSCVKRMKDTLQAYGYEMVNLMGEPYTDGMMVMARFEIGELETPDDNTPRITGVTKPQVNYHGRVIQVAEVTVRQPI